MPGSVLPTVVDAILALVLIEALLLCVYHRWTGGGIAPGRLLGNLAAGFFLMAGLRVALAGNASDWRISACLMAALVAHLADLASRWTAR